MGLLCYHFHLSPYQSSSVRSLSRVRLFVTPWTAVCQASLSITSFWSLLKLMSIESVMPSNHLILCHPFLLLPSIFPSIRVFSNESVLHIRWPKYWSFSFSISPSNENSGLISFRMDWLGLLAVQGVFKCLLHAHSLKTSILWCSAFFIIQLSHPLHDDWKNHLHLLLFPYIKKKKSFLSFSVNNWLFSSILFILQSVYDFCIFFLLVVNSSVITLEKDA